VYDIPSRCEIASKTAKSINGKELGRAHNLNEVAYLHRFGSLAQMTSNDPAARMLVTTSDFMMKLYFKLFDLLLNDERKIIDAANHVHITATRGNPDADIAK